MVSPEDFDLRLLDRLLKRDMSAIVFIRDYLQFQFDGPVLTAYVWPVVYISIDGYTAEQPGYRDHLCGFIGRMVLRVGGKKGAYIDIEFTGDRRLRFSLAEADQVGPEAMMFNDKEVWEVW